MNVELLLSTYCVPYCAMKRCDQGVAQTRLPVVFFLQEGLVIGYNAAIYMFYTKYFCRHVRTNFVVSIANVITI